MQDLYEELLKQPEPEARRVATALELYCTGSLNLFNHPTNVKTDSRVVCIVLKNMGGGKIKKQTPQQMMEEMISSRMPQAKEKKDLNSSKIRSNFEQKNRKFHEKMESGDS